MTESGLRFTSGRLLFVACATLLLIGILTYLQLAFQGADVRTAIRLVEEAGTGNMSLKIQMAEFLPSDHRLCQAIPVNRFHGHMNVTCSDTKNRTHELRWQVSVIDGLVIPANLAAEKLGKGEEPWPRR
ncbi:MAG TPA: hypothetical protein VI895_12550 [Bdellovibrionota bacterium]|nr:hypothetical protein [Bdellovibrionota bacterium]